MKELLEYIITSIVQFPDQIKINEENNDDYTTFLVNANSDDIGIIIGKNGRNIKAIKTLLNLKSDHRFSIELVDGKNRT